MLIIKNVNYLLCSSGDRSALIDTDIVFDRNGFPYIPAKRIKGVLKENFQDVLDMLGIEGTAMKSKIFGEEGNEYVSAGLLQIGNGYLENWENILSELKKKPIDPDDVKFYFTSEISQTTIDNEGIAEKRTLRNYRVLNPEYTFQCKFSLNEYETISTDEIVIIEKAILNMRYMGTRRNRGFGKIKCSVEWEISNNQQQKNIVTIKGLTHLKIELTTQSPVVLTTESLDVNTVATDKVISGNRVRGMLAAKFIKSHTIEGVESEGNLHVFQQLFLQEKLKFSPLYINGSIPVPLNLHQEKRSEDNQIMDVFFKSNNIITKPVTGFTQSNFLIKDVAVITKTLPSSTFYFHNQRPDRLAGRSTEDSGSIFYYEGLDSGQTFTGTISGNEEMIKLLTQYFHSHFNARLGRSKSTQYGQVKVSLAETKDEGDILEKSDQYYLVLQSPAVLFNPFGEAEPSNNILAKYLKDALEKEVRIDKAATATGFIEQYNNKWNCKTPKSAVFKEGSTFFISGLSNVEPQKLKSLIKNGIGELKDVGYGILKMIPVQKFPKNISIVKQENTIVPENEYMFKDSLLKKIEDQSEKKLKDIGIKNNAVHRAQHSRPITKNLIGRMLDLFQLANEEKGNDEKYAFIKNEIEEMRKAGTSKKPKPAFTSLKRAGLIDVDGNFQFLTAADRKVIPFNEQYLYWQTYFLTMRKLNKKEKNA